MSDSKTDMRIVRGSAIFYGDDEPGQKALLRIEAYIAELEGALETFLTPPVPEMRGEFHALRCCQCKHRWTINGDEDGEHHAENCAYQVATKILKR